MSQVCSDKGIGYIRRSGVQDSRMWKSQRPHASIVVRDRRGGDWDVKHPVVRTDRSELRRIFDGLAEEWKSATWHISSVRRRISHPAYLKIIGMGKEALPFIFDDMRKEPAHWFWALEAITRENVAPDCTSLREVHEAWLDWGKAHGY